MFLNFLGSNGCEQVQALGPVRLGACARLGGSRPETTESDARHQGGQTAEAKVLQHYDHQRGHVNVRFKILRLYDVSDGRFSQSTQENIVLGIFNNEGLLISPMLRAL